MKYGYVLLNALAISLFLSGCSHTAGSRGLATVGDQNSLRRRECPKLPDLSGADACIAEEVNVAHDYLTCFNFQLEPVVNDFDLGLNCHTVLLSVLMRNQGLLLSTNAGSTGAFYVRPIGTNR